MITDYFTLKSAQTKKEEQEQKSVEIVYDPENSIFNIETKSHDLIIESLQMAKAQTERTIYMDPASVFSFKSIVSTPEKAKKSRNFIKARINLEKEIEQIGINDINNFNSSKLSEEINDLHKYHIPKSLKEIKEAQHLNDVLKQQSKNAIFNREESPTVSGSVDLSTLNNSFPNQTIPKSSEELNMIINQIFKHYNEQNNYDLTSLL